MLNNFIYAKTKILFEEALNNDKVLDEAIVFIEDTKEIWTHGTYFDCSTTNFEEILSNYVDKTTAQNYVDKTTGQIISGLKTFTNHIVLNNKSRIRSNIDPGELKVTRTNDDKGFIIRVNKDSTDSILPLEILATNGTDSYQYNFPKKSGTVTLGVKKNGQVINANLTDGLIDLGDSCIRTTYTNLKNLRNNSRLIPGQKYRIIDYKTTVPALSGISVANHQFDIIVDALTPNTLSETAHAIKSDYSVGEKKQDLFSWDMNPGNWQSTNVPEIQSLTDLSIYVQQGTRTINQAGLVKVMFTAVQEDPETNDICIGAELIKDGTVVSKDYHIGRINYNPWQEENNIYYLPVYNAGSYVIKYYVAGASNNFETNLKVTAEAYDGIDYFANCNLNSWEIKYCLDGDTNRFQWANIDPNVSKGIIYYMKDDKGNECPYDFKNILFDNFYTFSYTVGGVLYDGTVKYQCYNNRILPTHNQDGVTKLNNNVFKNTSATSLCCFNVFGLDCEGNTFGDSCASNTFGNYCKGNSFGNNCQYNSFADFCQNNTFYHYCQSNSFGTYCTNNSFGSYIIRITFGKQCINCKFSNSASGNDQLLEACRMIKFGDQCNNVNLYNTEQPSFNAGKWMQNFEISNGLSGNIQIYGLNNSHITTISKDSDGTLCSKCLVDSPISLPNPYSLKFGDKIYNGSSEQTITPFDLGLGYALKYCGITSTALSDGSTTNPIVIDNQNHDATTGCVVFVKDTDEEYVFNGNKWQKLGYHLDLSDYAKTSEIQNNYYSKTESDGKYKPIQIVVSSPETDDTISTAFIDTISQDINGVITATKKTLPYIPIVDDSLSSTSINAIQNKIVYDELDKKVDKISGKGLSTNDFTDDYKDQLDNLPTSFAPVNAEANVQSDWNATSGDAFIQNKPVFLTGGSQTTTSSTSGGNNVYTFTKSNGGTSTLTVKNGIDGITPIINAKSGTYIGYVGTPSVTASTSGTTTTFTFDYLKGATGQRGSKWYTGTAVTGTTSPGTIFSSTGITDALANDYYLNTNTGYVYRCTLGGNANTAKWEYVGSIKGVSGANGTDGTDGVDGIDGASVGQLQSVTSSSSTTTTIPNTSNGGTTYYRIKDTNGNWLPGYIAVKNGTKGDNGDDGVSCTHSWNGTTLSITSASGTTSANLKGADGDDGKSVGSIVCTTSTTSTTTSTVNTSAGASNYYRIKDTDGNWLTGGIVIKNGTNGSDGNDGQRGSIWYTGTSITGTTSVGTIFSNSGITDAQINDLYLNTTTGNVYKCTVGGSASSAKWGYRSNIIGPSGTDGTDGTDGNDGYNVLISSASPTGTGTSVSITKTTISNYSNAKSGDIVICANGNVYQLTTVGSSLSTWYASYKFNIKGPQGPQGDSASGDYIPMTGSDTIKGTLEPNSTNAYDLGATDYRWNNIYGNKIYASTAFYQSSDALKKNIISDISLNIEDIANAPSVKFTWKHDSSQQAVGTIAQYWKEILPEIVKGEEGNYSVDYATLATINSISLAKKVIEQEARIAALEIELQNIKQHIKMQ